MINPSQLHMLEFFDNINHYKRKQSHDDMVTSSDLYYEPMLENLEDPHALFLSCLIHPNNKEYEMESTKYTFTLIEMQSFFQMISNQKGAKIYSVSLVLPIQDMDGLDEIYISINIQYSEYIHMCHQISLLDLILIRDVGTITEGNVNDNTILKIPTVFGPLAPWISRGYNSRINIQIVKMNEFHIDNPFLFQVEYSNVESTLIPSFAPTIDLADQFFSWIQKNPIVQMAKTFQITQRHSIKKTKDAAPCPRIRTNYNYIDPDKPNEISYGTEGVGFYFLRNYGILFRFGSNDTKIPSINLLDHVRIKYRCHVTKLVQTFTIPGNELTRKIQDCYYFWLPLHDPFSKTCSLFGLDIGEYHDEIWITMILKSVENIELEHVYMAHTTIQTDIMNCTEDEFFLYSNEYNIINEPGDDNDENDGDEGDDDEI